MAVKSTKVTLKRISALSAQKGLIIVEDVKKNMKNVTTLLQRKN